MKNKKILLASAIVMALCLLLPGCVTITISTQAPPAAQAPQPIQPVNAETIGDLAFSGDYRKDITVYVDEGSSYEPFLVVSGDYDGNALLLRKNLLDEYMPFHDENQFGSGGSYYPESDIDAYLNGVYFTSLPISLQEIILDTIISVATIESVSGGGAVAKTENIIRKIFLLSATELGIRSGLTCKEGTPLKYFSDRANWLATKTNGEEGEWWLRSSYLWTDISAWSIGSNGAYGGESVAFDNFGVRPAFTVDNKTVVKEMEGIIEGKRVFVLN